MQACKLDVYIPDNHRLEVMLPGYFPSGAAEVVILAKREDETARPDTLEAVTDTENLLAWVSTLTPGTHSEAEIEAWIEEERNAWGDD